MRNIFTLLPLFLSYLCISQTILYEKFESDTLPPGWTQETFASDGGWLPGNNYDLASAIFPIREHGNFIGTNDKCFCDKMNDFLMSPTMNLSSYTNVWLFYEYSYVDIFPQEFTLEISVDGGDTWNELENLPSSAAGYMGWWEVKFFNLSDYAGYDDVKLGFRYSDGGDWWSWGAAIDNFKVFQPLDYDVSLDSLYVSGKFAEIGSSITLSGVITNFGNETIHSFEAVWSDGTLENTVTVSGLEVEPFEKENFSHTVPYEPAEPIPYPVSLSVTSPNGADDMDLSDNQLSTVVHGCSSKPDKKAVAELSTGTWCSWCVRGHVYMDSMYVLYPENFIGIAVHNNDPMEVPEYDGAMYAYLNYLSFNGGAGYPSIIADHKFYMDPLDMPAIMPAMMDETVPVAIDIYGTYNDTTSTAIIDLKTTFVSRLTPIDYRINLIITEDSVTGTGSDYDQSNAYAGGTYGEMGGYELLPYIVPAEDMQYDHVARYLSNGWDGKEESHPSTVNDGDTVYNHYTVEIDADWNIEKLNVIATILDYPNGKFINANAIKLTELAPEPEPVDTSGTDTIVAVNSLSFITHLHLYPNPSDAFCIVNVLAPFVSELEITLNDMTGNPVIRKIYPVKEGENIILIETSILAAGMYVITACIGETVITEKITIAH